MTQNTYEPMISPSKLDGTIRTLSGRKFDFSRPSPEMIDIRDIASGLAYKGHFAGQTPKMFTIAQHCILVCNEYCLRNANESDEMKLMALLHDASEAYTGDIVKPLKMYLPNFVSLENSIMQAIALRFKLPIHRMSEIKEIDLLIQNLEYDGFFRGAKIVYHDPEFCRRMFLKSFKGFYHEQP